MCIQQLHVQISMRDSRLRVHAHLLSRRAAITFWVTCCFDVHNHNKLVGLLVNCIHEQLASLPIKSRTYQASSAVTGVMGLGLRVPWQVTEISSL